MNDATRVMPKEYSGIKPKKLEGKRITRTYEGNFAYWTDPGHWAKELLGEDNANALSNLGLALGMRTENEDLGVLDPNDEKLGKYAMKNRNKAWKEVFKANCPKYEEIQAGRQPERQPEREAGTFPKIDAETARRYILDEIDSEDHAYDLKRMERVAKERGYRLDYSRSMDDLGGHPERIYADRKVIYIASDVGGPGTWAALIAHALGHDSSGMNAKETDAQSHAARLTAELYGPDNPIAVASERLLPYM